MLSSMFPRIVTWLISGRALPDKFTNVNVHTSEILEKLRKK